MNIERRPSGKIGVQLTEDSDQFCELAELVRAALGGEWLQQLDHHDQSYWDLDVHGMKLTVHREHYLGVFVFCEDAPAHRELLERHLPDFENMVAT